MNNNLNICTFNFKQISGIEDYINFLKYSFSQKMDISVSKKIDLKKNNIFIDDFSEQSAIDYLIKIKTQNKKIKFSLILTEFFNNENKTLNGFEFKNKDNFNFLLKTLNLIYSIRKKFFNFFDNLPSIFYFIFINLIKLLILTILYLLPKKKIYSLNYSPKVEELVNKTKNKISIFFLFITYLILSPVILVLIISYGFKLNYIVEYYKQYRNLSILEVISKTKSNISNLLYFKKRYDGLLKIFPYIDIIYYSHPKIKETMNTKIFDVSNKIETNIFFFPKKEKIKLLNKKNNIYFSGELTKYRYNILNTYKIKNKDWRVNSTNFNHKIFATYHIKDSINEYSFSLNPKKNEFWNFSSPTRYIRALNRNEIPIVIDHFNDYTKYLTFYCDLKNLILSDLIKKKKKIINKLNKNLIKFKFFIFKFI